MRTVGMGSAKTAKEEKVPAGLKKEHEALMKSHGALMQEHERVSTLCTQALARVAELEAAQAVRNQPQD